MALETPVSPLLDAGGNVAISPSGRRVAAVNAGAIQIFELPAPPPLPAFRHPNFRAVKGRPISFARSSINPV